MRAGGVSGEVWEWVLNCDVRSLGFGSRGERVDEVDVVCMDVAFCACV